MSAVNPRHLDSDKPFELFGVSADDLCAIMASFGEPAYRGRQVYRALYAEHCNSLDAITTLPLALRERLSRDARITWPRIIRRHASADGTVRYVLALGQPPKNAPENAAEVSHDPAPDPAEQSSVPRAAGRVNDRAAAIETVFMPSPARQTICISTQAGCAVDCHFCLTATLGLVRNLTTGEIIGQVLLALEENRAALRPQTNVVLMGQGEPLLNYEFVMSALRILLDPEGVGLSPRHVTLSTSGIVPGIERMAAEPVRPKLAISLNASTDEQRDAVMPINRKYPLGMLLDACHRYPLRTWERLTFEYVLLGGTNDTPEDARRLARLLAGMRCKVNLIPWNPGELPYRAPLARDVEKFQGILEDKGFPAFVRLPRGQDVMAACGQLALLESILPAPAPSEAGDSVPPPR
jgi:23S rRNA (adenine2503-C2)-methyltransferase